MISNKIDFFKVLDTKISLRKNKIIILNDKGLNNQKIGVNMFWYLLKEGFVGDHENYDIEVADLSKMTFR